LRIPKARGFRNKIKSDKPKVFNLGELALVLKTSSKGSAPVELNREFLKVAGLLGKNFTGIIKILGNGEVAVPVSVKGLQVSAAAKTKIEKAGGTVVK
jgi:large subunit ribosomal protein L15